VIRIKEALALFVLVSGYVC